MAKNKQAKRQNSDTTAALRTRLEEMEETLRAIQQYMVDAFVVNRENGIQVVTLNESEIPYRLMIESMNEGAVTLIPDGTIFYCNTCFGKMVQTEPENLIGTSFRDLVLPEQQSVFSEMLEKASKDPVRGEFCLPLANGKCLPVQLSIYKLGEENPSGLSVIATDMSERKQNEEKIRQLAAELTRAEQEERHRISQVLHDDLQQRLFALRAQLSLAAESFRGETVPPAMQAYIDQVQDWLYEVITITRNLSVDISPPILHGEGITEAIQWLSSRMMAQYGLQVDVQARDDFTHLPDHVRVTLFQAVRETFFNIVKHAGTLQAGVALEKQNGHGCIIINDPGKGFNVNAVMSDLQASHGLIVIRDRLNLMGGSIDIESAPGRGTRTTIKFPIEPLSAT